MNWDFAPSSFQRSVVDSTTKNLTAYRAGLPLQHVWHRRNVGFSRLSWHGLFAIKMMDGGAAEAAAAMTKDGKGGSILPSASAAYVARPVISNEEGWNLVHDRNLWRQSSMGSRKINSLFGRLHALTDASITIIRKAAQIQAWVGQTAFQFEVKAGKQVKAIWWRKLIPLPRPLYQPPSFPWA